MSDLLREAPIGQIVRYLTRNKAFPYPEELPGFVIPWEGVAGDVAPAGENLEGDSSNQSEHDAVEEDLEKAAEPCAVAGDLARKETAVDRDAGALRAALTRTKSRQDTVPWSVERFETERQEEMEKNQSSVIVPQKTSDGITLVDWYTTDDPANPQNWGSGKKAYIALVMFLYTFAVYCASAIYTSAEPYLMKKFNIGQSKASLGLSMYVIGYGIGPLLFSPLSEIPTFGRNAPYLVSFGLYVILNVPLALVDNYAGLLVLRFLTGFMGSPCLATGAASMQDIYSFLKLPYALTAWVAAAFCAPALGPVLSGFSIPVEGWRWFAWESLWMAAPVFIAMLFTFPETSADNILLRRARRLRKLTGNPMLKSQSEITQGEKSLNAVVIESLWRPIQICILDPAVLFTNLYTSLIYGIYYSYFEAFPLVYIDKYGFNLGEMGAVFTCIVVGAVLGIIVYCSYVYFFLEPDIKKNGLRAQEHRLFPALFAVVLLPVGLFIFAWTSRPDIHWIVSVIGITLFAFGAFVLLQCVFMYLPLSYPQYAASLFATNDTCRSALAAGSIIFAHPLYVNLGIGRGVSILGGLAAGGCLGIWALYLYGAKLRARSRFAMA